MKLHLRKFDIGSISDDKVVVFIGMRGTGKSYLVKDLLYHHKNIPIGTVISGTEGANKFYSDIIPSFFIHEKISSNTIENVMRRQDLIVKKMNKDKKKHGRTNIDPRAFLILDDCLYKKNWVNDENIRALFMNGRHFKIMFLLTMQYPLGVPPILRTNIDYVFILRENKINNRKRIYDNYAGMFPSFEMFCQVMDQCTENYECLVIDNHAQSNKLEEQVFWYKAEHREPFRIGAKEFWKWQEECQEESSDDDGEELFDISRIKHKKNHPVIRVKKDSKRDREHKFK